MFLKLQNKHKDECKICLLKLCVNNENLRLQTNFVCNNVMPLSNCASPPCSRSPPRSASPGRTTAKLNGVGGTRCPHTSQNCQVRICILI